MAPNDEDVLSEILIAQILEEDLKVQAWEREAEKLQLELALSQSARAGGLVSEETRGSSGTTPPRDIDIALQLLAADARLTSDAAYAQSLQVSGDAAAIADRQCALKWAAADKKALLDAEFAKRLHEMSQEGLNEDDPRLIDAERLLGKDVIEHILSSDPNSKGKGKTIRPVHQQDSQSTFDKVSETSYPKPTVFYPTCGICLEPFQATYSPLTAALSANSSSRVQFGLRLPCPQEHGYCISCLTSYLRTKLDPEGDGSGDTQSVVFPIRCPECPAEDWREGISDAVAERILSEKGMLLWHRQKLLDTIPRYYCPNPRCSALVQPDEDLDDPQAICPVCETLICVPCKVIWHDNMTCEDYQALPVDERSPEDRQVLQLAKVKNWRRCPKCTAIVELTMGCNHVQCRCGEHFCFKCGSKFDKGLGRCTSDPACSLWDEEMLLEERERQRQPPVVNPRPAPVLREPVREIAPPPYVERQPRLVLLPHQAVRDTSFDWINDPNVVCDRHRVTTDMIQNLTCVYCDNRLTSLADLQYHLRHVRRHPIYACCGRFFKRDVDFDRHVQNVTRFGVHVHQIRQE